MTLAANAAISPCLWFDHELEEAADVLHLDLPELPRRAHGPLHRVRARASPGTVMAGDFTLDGLTFRGINGGPDHAGFTETISFSVTCADQAEVDHYWTSLTADGGEESVCGWLKDRFGLSWQIVPKRLYELMEDPDPARATRRHRGDAADAQDRGRRARGRRRRGARAHAS